MTISSSQITRALLLVAVGAALSACGGGGGSGANNTSTLVSGVAATGLAIDNGRVTLKCANGTTPSVSTSADGSFTVDVSKMTLPCVARVDFKDGTGTAQQLHSLVERAGTVNITPVTDMLVATLSNSIAADAYDHFDATRLVGMTAERISTATQTVKTKLESKGIDTSKLPLDVIGEKFVAATASTKGDGQDSVLDDMKVKLASHGTDMGQLEKEMSSDNGAGGFVTSNGLPADAAAGKAAYDATCASCHGMRFSDAANANNILEAIKENKGGMGLLTGSVSASVANNIATYMANGLGSSTLKAQTITFTSPGNQTLGVATPALAASATSGLPVSIESTTPLVCTVTNSAVTLVSAGNCTLVAAQSGNASWAAAATVTHSFTVASASGPVLLAQTITFTSPGAQILGVMPVTLSATSTSNLPVTFASTTPTVCTVNAQTLTLLTAGNCTITAGQAGNASYAAAATASNTVSVTAPATAVSAANGKALYVSNSCGACHGTPPSMSNVLNGANSPTTIQNAISSIGMMRSFSGLTSQNLADIAAYLATPNI